MRPVSLAPSQAPGTAVGDADGEDGPVHLQLERVTGEAGDAEEEADDKVRAHGPRGREADASE